MSIRFRHVLCSNKTDEGALVNTSEYSYSGQVKGASRVCTAAMQLHRFSKQCVINPSHQCNFTWLVPPNFAHARPEQIKLDWAMPCLGCNVRFLTVLRGNRGIPFALPLVCRCVWRGCRRLPQNPKPLPHSARTLACQLHGLVYA